MLPTREVLAMMVERMLALLVISIVCFFSLFFAMLALLRRAALRGIARSTPRYAVERHARGSRDGVAHLAMEDSAGEGDGIPNSRPLLPNKRPDWRFLVREGRPFPSRNVVAPARKHPVPNSHGRARADWAHYNKDLGDLNDPYQAPPSTARRA